MLSSVPTIALTNQRGFVPLFFWPLIPVLCLRACAQASRWVSVSRVGEKPIIPRFQPCLELEQANWNFGIGTKLEFLRSNVKWTNMSSKIGIDFLQWNQVLTRQNSKIPKFHWNFRGEEPYNLVFWLNADRWRPPANAKHHIAVHIPQHRKSPAPLKNSWNLGILE